MICQMPLWISAHIHAGDIFTIHNFDRVRQGDQVNLVARGEHLLPIKRLGHIASSGAMEAYAGLGGWSQGAALCGLLTTLCIEIDPEAAQACGKSLGWSILSLPEAYHALQHGTLPKKFVLQADANSLGALYFVGLHGSALWLISPPCQPWSKAGNQRGLENEGGQAFVTTIIDAAMMGASMVLAENVPGFPSHKDYKHVINFAKQAGWHCVLSSQDGGFLSFLFFAADG